MIRVELGGLLGEAIDAGRRGRLHHFISGPESPALALFARAAAQHNREGDWYGEHAGKWLVAASRAAARSDDDALAAKVRAVADFLCDQQEADGYLGTYAADRRFMVPQPPKPPSWDGAPSVRTWDVWTHSYLILGLLEAHRHFGAARWRDAACRIGDLCWQALSVGGIDITDLGNHHGMSATVLMEPATELFFATGEQRYLDLALRVLEQADAHAPLALLRRARAGADAAEIATGKAYQLAWNLVGLAKLHRATGRADLREAVDKLWSNIREHHLTLGGGPWGGVAHRSREVFNPAAVFSPQGYVETCSTMAWIQLNRELLGISGQARYAEAIEHAVWNDLLGAMAANGEDWCYYVFPNGRRVHTTAWRCCKSSGAMALEELPPLVCSAGRRDDGLDEVSFHLHGPVTVRVNDEVTLVQRTGYPFDGDIALGVSLPAPRRFVLRLRIPSWAAGATLSINGQQQIDAESVPDAYCAVDRTWADGDTLQLRLPMAPRAHRRSQRNVQESKAPDGTAVKQEVLRHDYIAFTRGPLVYATSLIDGYKSDESLQLPADGEAEWLHCLPATGDDGAPLLQLRPLHRAPIHFVPYYRAGGRNSGAWRLTWMSLAPDTTTPPWTEEPMP